MADNVVDGVMDRRSKVVQQFDREVLLERRVALENFVAAKPLGLGIFLYVPAMVVATFRIWH